MPKPKRTKFEREKLKREANIYDKVFKENIEPLLFPLLNVLGLKIKSSTVLTQKQQTTIERELDFLYKIELENGEIYILHIEVESGNNLNMVYRLVEYNGIVLRRYKLPIKHFVIYLGEKESKMPTQLRFENFFFAFEKVELRQLNTEKLLRSQIPEELLLAFLSDYSEDKAETIIREIRNKLLNLCKTDIERSKYFNQLLILAGLRSNLDSLTDKILSEMPITIDFSNHVLVKKGREEGREEEKYHLIKDLILQTDFNNLRIAELTRVSVDYVEKIRLEISSNLN